MLEIPFGWASPTGNLHLVRLSDGIRKEKSCALML